MTVSKWWCGYMHGDKPLHRPEAGSCPNYGRVWVIANEVVDGLILERIPRCNLCGIECGEIYAGPEYPPGFRPAGEDEGPVGAVAQHGQVRRADGVPGV